MCELLLNLLSLNAKVPFISVGAWSGGQGSVDSTPGRRRPDISFEIEEQRWRKLI